MTSKLFETFTALDCNREEFILSYLSERGIKSAILAIEGRRHIYVKFPPRQYNPMFRMKTVIAHYDRAEGTPGANDNSAAVSYLLDWAVKLIRNPSFHNVRLIFTDGEEGEEGEGVKAQGAFNLAAVFRRLGISSVSGEDVYVFDCVGRGTLPILAASSYTKRLPASFSRSLLSLEERVQLLLQKSTKNHLRLPLPYSDNAGFIAQGIAAVCITMLPSGEAQSYLASLMKEEGLRHYVLNMGGAKKEESDKYKKLLPPTWALFHTMEDNVKSLTKESEETMQSILDALAASREVK